MQISGPLFAYSSLCDTIIIVANLGAGDDNCVSAANGLLRVFVSLGGLWAREPSELRSRLLGELPATQAWLASLAAAQSSINQVAVWQLARLPGDLQYQYLLL